MIRFESYIAIDGNEFILLNLLFCLRVNKRKKLNGEKLKYGHLVIFFLFALGWKKD